MNHRDGGCTVKLPATRPSDQADYLESTLRTLAAPHVAPTVRRFRAPSSVATGDRRVMRARRLRLLAMLTDGTGAVDPDRICEVCAEATGMSGAGIMLMADAAAGSSLCATDEVSTLISELQYDLGEGPAVDAFREDRPVTEPDLAQPRTTRWVGFSGPALDAGVRAVFAFPLRIGGVRLGAVQLHCDKAGSLTDEQHADAVAMADIATRAVLVMQSDADPGKLAVELGDGTGFHYVVHQASGMVAAQLDVSVTEALVRLRAHAYGNDRPLVDVSTDVVARRLRFGTDGEGDRAP